MSKADKVSDEVWRWTPGARSLRGALAQLGVAGLALAGVEVVLFAHGPIRPLWPFVFFAAVGVEYVAAGLLAWVRRPGNGTGALLTLCASRCWPRRAPTPWCPRSSPWEMRPLSCRWRC